MITFPNAKINLGLNILSKREDGYHNISSCLYPIPLQDMLEIVPAKKFQFDTTGIPISGHQDENLIVMAYTLLKEKHALPPVHIHLHKLIPMGAGLGGGSSNAAFTIKCLNTLFELSLSNEEMEKLASGLGSDCPFFIRNQPAIAEDTGTTLSSTSLSLKGKYILLITPEIHIGTAEAYRNITLQPNINVRTILDKEPIEKWKNQLKNDFEATLFPVYPRLAEIKEILYEAGALYASLSGSGSAMYGIFDMMPDHLKLSNSKGFLL